MRPCQNCWHCVPGESLKIATSSLRVSELCPNRTDCHWLNTPLVSFLLLLDTAGIETRPVVAAPTTSYCNVDLAFDRWKRKDVFDCESLQKLGFPHKDWWGARQRESLSPGARRRKFGPNLRSLVTWTNSSTVVIFDITTESSSGLQVP